MRTLLPFVALLHLGLLAHAQDPAPKSDTGTAREPSTTQAPSKSAGEWIADLGDESFRVRLQAEKALRALGKEALPELEKAAASKDAEVQWRARRLIRQIENGSDGGLGKRTDPFGQDPQQDPQRSGGGAPGQPFGWQRAWGGTDPFDVQQRFDDLFQHLERDFGMDIPRGRFFHDDFFQDLQRQMQQMQQLQQGMQGAQQGQTMSVQIGPDGVRVEQRVKNEKGEEEVKTYEAPDLETFKSKYPGVLESNGLGGNFRFFLDGGRGFGGRAPVLGLPNRGQWQQQAPQRRPLLPDVQQDEDLPLPPAGKRLGVVVRPEIPVELRDYLGLEEGQGLMVEEVQSGTLAESLGMQPRDIVLRIGDRTIGTTDDVQQALGAIEPGSKVDVTVLRSGKEQTLHATKPQPTETKDPAPLEKRSKPSDIK